MMIGSPRFRLMIWLCLGWWLVGIGLDLDAQTTKETKPPGDFPGKITITLKAKAVAQGDVVALGDVADLTGGSDAVRARMAGIDIADINQVTALTVKRRQIDFRLRLADFPAKLYEINGDSECSVSVERSKVSLDNIKTVAIEAVAKHLPWARADLEIRLTQPISIAMPEINKPKDVSIKVEPNGGNVNLGRAQMNVSIYEKQEHKLSFPVYLESKLIQKIAVAKRALEKGESISIDDVIVERRPIDQGTKPATVDTLIGQQLKRSLSPGAVIQTSDVMAAPREQDAVLVRSKKPVEIVVKLGSINVCAKGESLQDGKMGELIRVQNTTSQKVLKARVTGLGTVEVEQ